MQIATWCLCVVQTSSLYHRNRGGNPQDAERRLDNSMASTSGRLPSPGPTESPVRLNTQWQGLDQGAAVSCHVLELRSPSYACCMLHNDMAKCVAMTWSCTGMYRVCTELDVPDVQRQEQAGDPLAMNMPWLLQKTCCGERSLQQMTPHSDPLLANLLLEQSQTSRM